MGMLILSSKAVETLESFKNIVVVAWEIGAQFGFDEQVYSGNQNKKKGMDLYISKHYGGYEDDAEYFWIGVESMQNILSTYDLLDLKIGKYYRLAVTDQADYPRLMYDFALQYLRMNPDHIISTFGEYFFSHDDMERIEKKGGYYKDWCYVHLPWQKHDS